MKLYYHKQESWSTIRLLEVPEESKYYRSNVYKYQKNECNAGNEQEDLKKNRQMRCKKDKTSCYVK